jgi:hypothetical protein
MDFRHRVSRNSRLDILLTEVRKGKAIKTWVRLPMLNQNLRSSRGDLVHIERVSGGCVQNLEGNRQTA